MELFELRPPGPEAVEERPEGLGRVRRGAHPALRRTTVAGKLQGAVAEDGAGAAAADGDLQARRADDLAHPQAERGIRPAPEGDAADVGPAAGAAIGADRLQPGAGPEARQRVDEMDAELDHAAGAAAPGIGDPRGRRPGQAG